MSQTLRPSKRTSKSKASGNVIPLRPLTTGEERFRQRLAGESEAAFALRQRHHVALVFARRLVTVLDAPGASAADLERAIAAVEAARKGWVGGTDAPRLIGAVRDALERARKWEARRAQHEREWPSSDGGNWAGPDAETIREGASRSAPELAEVPLVDWTHAIAAWPGFAKRGGARKKGENRTAWYDVVFDLLKPHALTGAKDAAALKSTWETAEPKAARASRAKK